MSVFYRRVWCGYGPDSSPQQQPLSLTLFVERFASLNYNNLLAASVKRCRFIVAMFMACVTCMVGECFQTAAAAAQILITNAVPGCLASQLLLQLLTLILFPSRLTEEANVCLSTEQFDVADMLQVMCVCYLLNGMKFRCVCVILLYHTNLDMNVFFVIQHDFRFIAYFGRVVEFQPFKSTMQFWVKIS